MSDATIWWILAGLLVGAELVSGTLYLLMLVLGAVAGGAVAYLDHGLNAQLVTAAVVGGAAVVLWYLRQQRRRASEPASVQPADAPAAGLGHLDVGEQVIVSAWDADGTTRVQHRGSQWRARLARPEAPHPGPHRICAIERNLLVLEPV